MFCLGSVVGVVISEVNIDHLGDSWDLAGDSSSFGEPWSGWSCACGRDGCSIDGDVDLPSTPPEEPGRRPTLFGAVYPGVTLKLLPQFEASVSFQVWSLGGDGVGLLGDECVMSCDVSGESDRIITLVAVCLGKVNVVVGSLFLVISVLGIGASAAVKSVAVVSSPISLDKRLRVSEFRRMEPLGNSGAWATAITDVGA